MVEISLQVFVEEDHPKSCKNFAMLMLPCGLTIERSIENVIIQEE